MYEFDTTWVVGVVIGTDTNTTVYVPVVGFGSGAGKLDPAFLGDQDPSLGFMSILQKT
jgi:hypothetical protein